jgi:hypothetical protein
MTTYDWYDVSYQPKTTGGEEVKANCPFLLCDATAAVSHTPGPFGLDLFCQQQEPSRSSRPSSWM